MMRNPITAGILGVLLLASPFAASEEALAQPAAKKESADTLDLAHLLKVDVPGVVRDGLGRGKTDFQAVLQEADERIAAIRKRNGYTELDLDMLARPWVRTKEFLHLLQQRQPLPDITLGFRGQRNGVFETGGTEIFKGDVKRGVAILREIGLKDTANGKSWSAMWGIMERTPTVLGKRANGDIVLRVDVVLGVNQWLNIVYKMIYNVRDIERYVEYDLGDGSYVVVQDMIRDDSAGAAPRRPTRGNWPAKPYCPVREQISITILRDNKDWTFTLGSFMSTHGQELTAGVADHVIDLLKIMEKDTIKNRRKWNELFQKEVLAGK